MKKFLLMLVPVVFLMGCSIAGKSWGSAGSCDAFKVVVSDVQSGNYVPTVIAGGGSHVMLFNKPYTNNEVVPTSIGYARRQSMWNLFSDDLSTGNVSFLYIAGSQENPADTARILEAIAKIVNDKTIKEIPINKPNHASKEGD